MKRFGKKLAALVIAAAMAIPAGAVFADGTEDFRSSHIEWIETTSKEGVEQLTAKALVRNYAQTPEATRVSCAVYDANNNLLRVGAQIGKTGNLRATVTKPAEGETVKAFVWSAVGQNPIRMVSTYGTALADMDYELLLDGMSISAYTGNAVQFAKDTASYTVNLAVDAVTRRVAPPRITIASSDNAVSVSASAVDDTHTKATVRNSAKGESKEYTFTWVVPTDLVTADQFEDFDSSIVGGEDTLWNKYEQSYTVPEGETKTIALTSSGFTMQREIIIAVPADGNKAEDVIVDLGLDYSWVTDPYVVAGYDAETGEITYGEVLGRFSGQVPDGPVVLTNFNNNTNTAVFRHLQNSDNNRVTGSRLARDRHPLRMQIEATNFPEEWLGCNYIALPSVNATTSATVTFTIGRSAKIIMLSPNGARTVTDGDGNTYAVSGVGDIKPQVRYSNLGNTNAANQAATAAFMVASGYTTDAYIDVSTVSLPWSAVYQMVDAGHSKIKQTKAGTIAANLQTYPAMLEKIGILGDSKIISNLRFADGISTAGNANGTYNGTLQVTTLEMGKRYLSDRDANTGATWGTIPTGLELEGAELIMGWQECANHNGNSETTIWSTAGRALYHFEVTCDAEVYVIASASAYDILNNPILRPSANSVLSGGGGMIGMWGIPEDDDTFRPVNSAFGGVSIREIARYSAGDTVTIQANGVTPSNTKVMVVVKPFNE